jgi:hypothetical protein
MARSAKVAKVLAAIVIVGAALLMAWIAQQALPLPL